MKAKLLMIAMEASVKFGKVDDIEFIYYLADKYHECFKEETKKDNYGAEFNEYEADTYSSDTKAVASFDDKNLQSISEIIANWGKMDD